MTWETVNEESTNIDIVSRRKRTMTDHGGNIDVIVDEMMIESVQDGRKVRMNDGIEKKVEKNSIPIGSMTGIEITVRREDGTGIGIMREIVMVLAVRGIVIMNQDTIAASSIPETTLPEESTEKGGIEVVETPVLMIVGEYGIGDLQTAYTH